MAYPRPQFSFVEKAVLVTGGTSGMGEAIAESFAASRADVVITGRNRERGNAVCARMSGHGNIAKFKAGDIADSSFCDELVDYAVQTMGKLDIVVNSAGIIYHAAVEVTTDEQWLDTFDVNVNGMFYVCRAAIPRLRQTGGVIINIASDAGLTGSRHLVVYCASKGAVIQMSRAMAVDHAPKGYALFRCVRAMSIRRCCVASSSSAALTQIRGLGVGGERTPQSRMFSRGSSGSGLVCRIRLDALHDRVSGGPRWR